MKRLILGAFVAAIALSASAFTNANTVVGVQYYQNADDVYVLVPATPPTGMCSIADSDPCTYTFTNESIKLDHPTFTKEQIQSESLLSTYNGTASTTNRRKLL